jgi:hypothetical protein
MKMTKWLKLNGDQPIAEAELVGKNHGCWQKFGAGHFSQKP